MKETEITMRTIKNFKDYIKEGFVNKTLKRTRQGIDRSEDKINQGDVDQLDPEHVSDFVIDHKLRLEVSMFIKEVDDTFTEPLKNYMTKNGFDRCGFGTRDSSKLPDFDYKFRIKDLKDMLIHVHYDDFEKEVKVYCGDNDEFDVTELKFPQMLVWHITHTKEHLIKTDPKLILLNIKKKWRYFESELRDAVFMIYYNNCKYEPGTSMRDVEIHVDDLPSTFVKEYYFEGVNFKNSVMMGALKIHGASSSKSNPTYKKILDTLEKIFMEAKEKAYPK